MKIYIASDIHENWHHFPAPEPKYDMILIAGDLTCRGSPSAWEACQTWLNLITKQGKIPAYFVPGNHDLDCPELRYAENVLNRVVRLPNGLNLLGLSLSPCYNLPWLEEAWVHLTSKPEQEMNYYAFAPKADVILSHCPPFGKLGSFVDSHGNKISIGSKGLRAYVKRHKPKAVICGHVHESAGFLRIKKTKVWNTACQGAIITLN